MIEGAWHLRDSQSQSITIDTPFNMNATVGAESAANITATVAAGQVGLWAGDSSGSSFDDFEAKDAAGPYEVDGRWFTNRGEARIDASDSNVLETFGDDIAARTLVRRGFRGDKFVLTYRFKWDSGMRKPGVLVRWVSPGDWLAIQINSSDQLARLMRRKDDDSVSTLKTSGTALSLSAATWYTGKVVVDHDPNNAALQRMRFWVDTDDDGDYGDETVLLTSTHRHEPRAGGLPQ